MSATTGLDDNALARAHAKLDSVIRALSGPDGPERRRVLAHLASPEAAGALPYVAARLAETVRSARRGWRQAAAAITELGAHGAEAVAGQLLKGPAAAGQCRLIGVLAETPADLPESARAALLMQLSALWIGGRTEAVKE